MTQTSSEKSLDKNFEKRFGFEENESMEVGAEEKEAQELHAGQKGEVLKETLQVAMHKPANAKQQVNDVIAEADTQLKLIEDILSDGLGDIYQGLPDTQKVKFKAKGEETAQKIQQMITGAKIKTQKIIDWIIDWLKTIPHVNKYFLRQEAKLKTDKIIAHIESQKSE